MNVCDTSSHADTLMYQIWYDYIKGQKYVARTGSNVQHSINLTLISKVNMKGV